MFEIRTGNFEGFETLILFNTISEEYVSIIPTHGGNLHELVLQKENILHDILYKNSTKKELTGSNRNFYRGAKLSPFPNRIDKGEYAAEGIMYALPKNDNNVHALHGLLWNKSFEIETKETSLEYAELRLCYAYKKESEGYPFSYDINITYQLHIEGVTISTRIKNTSDTAIPIADGWHPYLTTGVHIDQLTLKIPSNQKIVTDESLIPTGEVTRDTKFEKPASMNGVILDSCFIVNTLDEIAETILFDAEQNLSIVVWQETNDAYPYVHIYTPPDRMSLAIEPTSCIPNAFASKNSIDMLKPGDERMYRFGVMVR